MDIPYKKWLDSAIIDIKSKAKKAKRSNNNRHNEQSQDPGF